VSRPQLIDERVGDPGVGDEHTAPVDEVVLTSEERIRGHLRTRSVGGRELAISLPRGTALDDGDVLRLSDSEGIVVRAAVEELLEVRPQDAREGAAVGYTIGNLHRPLRLVDGTVLTAYDAAVVHALAAIGVEARHVKKPFVGERLTAAHHDHAHR
jgi:urease accessory protein